jgi:hypothetical protein
MKRFSTLDSYSIQSENLFLTYSCHQKVDNFLNGITSSATCWPDRIGGSMNYEASDT